MKFKEGDRVEVIWRSELHQGVVAHISEITNELNIKPDFTSQGTILFNQNQVRKVKLVKVPQFVADWIKYCEKHCWGLVEALEDTYESSCMPEEVMDWFEDCRENQEFFARAWLDGYEVEKEPLYYVRFFDGGLGFLNILKEFKREKPTRRWIAVEVAYITDYEQKEGYVVMGIKLDEDYGRGVYS
ncbi:TPA: DUF1642 domain-containing protein [Listeria monocytogenes]|nr:DUF1642 domain-containing protein [Listeria monocytogenes]